MLKLYLNKSDLAKISSVESKAISCQNIKAYIYLFRLSG